MSDFKLENTAYIKSTTIVNDRSSAQIISEKDITTGENRLKIIRDPKRTFWVTKKFARNHEERKEFEELRNLDEYTAPEHDVAATAASAIAGYRPAGYLSLYNLRSPQYVYAADMSLDVLTKMKYRKHCPHVDKLNIGALDIETSVLGDKQIIVVTYLDMNTKNVYTYILREFLKGHSVDEIRNDYKTEYEKFIKVLHAKRVTKNKIPKYLQYLNDNDFSYHIKVYDTEKQLLLAIFQALHSHKPDYVIGWNIEYDLLMIEKRALFRGINIADLFCHPDVPKEFRRYEYRKKPLKPNEHITDRWIIPISTGYTTYIDAMCLYGRLRKVKGRDISYKLDFIGYKELGTGKINIDGGNTHYKLQREQPVKYCVYNIFDVLILILMEIKNEDILNMLGILSDSVVNEFAYQTTQGKNMMYSYLINNGAAPAIAVGKQARPEDIYFNKAGGAVLSPALLTGSGVPIIKGCNKGTSLWKYLSDLDVSKRVIRINHASGPCNREVA